MIKCTSCVRERMTVVAQIYFCMIQRGQIELSSDISEQNLALHYMQDAFRVPPIFHFPSGHTVPLHCLDLDLLDAKELDVAVENGRVFSYVQPRLLSDRHLKFSFLRHTGVHELSQHEFLLVDSVFRRIGREHCASQTAALFVQRQAGISHQQLTVFGAQEINDTVLVARSDCILLLALVMCNAEQRNTVLENIESHLSDERTRAMITSQLATLPTSVFTQLVADLQMYLSVEIIAAANPEALVALCRVIDACFQANYTSQTRDGILSFEHFYNGVIAEFRDEDIERDVVRLFAGQFSFSSFPCLLNARYKSLILQLEASIERDEALRDAVVTNLFSHRGNEVLEDYFLVLKVERSNLVQSAVSQLRSKRTALRKPLRIHFVGEEGVDEGGLKKEFFQLLLRELLHPNYNMFSCADGSQTLWFVPEIQNSINSAEYFLIGQCIGLAVYNNITLDVAFPPAIFRKLLSVPVTFADLAVIDTQLYHGLRALLSFDEQDGETVENVFCRRFTFEHHIFGERVEVPLIPGGEAIPLSNSNREHFVNVTAEYILSTSIARNFDAFKDGFFSVCTRGLLTAIRPEELESIVCGQSHLNIAELQRATVYEGFQDDDDVVVQLWEVVSEMSDVDQRRFLKFCTGSDRVPVGGVEDLHLIIGKNGDDSDLLPTSHTCFNHLLLPAYSSKEKMRVKLSIAIENCEGFFGGK